MNNSHCGKALITTHDNRSFVRKRCQVCKLSFMQHKRLPANTIRVKDKINMIGECKKDHLCGLAEAKAMVEKNLATNKIEVI